MVFFLPGLAFHMKDPGVIRYTINIFMFPELYLVVGYKATMIAGDGTQCEITTL